MSTIMRKNQSAISQGRTRSLMSRSTLDEKLLSIRSRREQQRAHRAGLGHIADGLRNTVTAL